MKTALRWIAFVPCMIVAYFLVYWVAKVVAHFLLGETGIPFFYSIDWEDQLWYQIVVCIKNCIISIVASGTAMTAALASAMSVVPSHKRKVAIIISIFMIALLAVSFVLSNIPLDANDWSNNCCLISEYVTSIVVIIVFLFNMKSIEEA